MNDIVLLIIIGRECIEYMEITSDLRTVMSCNKYYPTRNEDEFITIIEFEITELFHLWYEKYLTSSDNSAYQDDN